MPFAPGDRIFRDLASRDAGTLEQPQDEKHLSSFLSDNESVKYIRLQWVDLSGVMRTRVIPKTRALGIAKGTDHFKLAQNCMIIPILPAPEAFCTNPESWQLHPHWSSLRLCGHSTKHGMVMCSTEHKGKDNPFAKCPRTLLMNTLERYPKDARFKMGLELEFVLLDEHLNISKPLDNIAGYSMMAGLRGKTLDIVEEILEAMEASDIPIYHFHTETDDQLEIALGPGPPMRAIDDFMYAQEIIRAICIRHGLKATLTPKPVFAESPHNGVHIHLSCIQAKVMQSILAGTLQKMKAIAAFGIANVDGYVRVMNDGAGVWIGYGTENRDLPVRRINDDHFEFRFADATANLYLFTAVLLSAGLGDTWKSKPMPWKDCPLPVYEDGKGLDKYGITERMPKSMVVSLDALKQDGDIKDWVGGEMYDQYISIKGHELDYADKMADEARRQKFLTFF